MTEGNYPKVRIAENLKSYQELHKYTLAEFAQKLGIPKSTLQSVMQDGNTTVDTLIKIQQGLGMSLDELVYGEMSKVLSGGMHELLKGISRYADMDAAHQERLRNLMNSLFDELKND